MKTTNKLVMHANGGCGLFWLILFAATWDVMYAVMGGVNLGIALSLQRFVRN